MSFGTLGLWFDPTYLILLPAILFSLWAQIRVSSTFRKYSAVRTRGGMTGYAAARAILDRNGLHHIQIEHIPGELNDHYDPTAGVIRLSDSTYGSDSAAAVGVAAHEAGHAVQHATDYFPIRIRSTIIPITNIGSRLTLPLILIGLLLSFQPLITLGILTFSLSTLFQLITLPVEYDASRRAMAALEESRQLDTEELRSAKKVLSAAALTYVAALAVSLLQLLRLILLFGGNRRSRR